MCVGLDTHKAKIAVAVAEPGREGEVRFHGEIANQPALGVAVGHDVLKLLAKHIRFSQRGLRLRIGARETLVGRFKGEPGGVVLFLGNAADR